MFTLLNINKINTHLAIKVTSPANESIELTIGPMISKRDREELIVDRQFELINNYLEYKGEEFKNILYQTIIEASYAVEESSFSKGLSNPPTKEIYRVLDLFDMADVKHFIRDISGVMAPDNLKDTFDTRIESDGLGTRIQTYLKDDYYDLAALTIPIKAIIGLLGQYAVRKDSSMSPMHREYVLYGIFAKHPIMTHPAIIKLREWGCVLIDLNIQDSDTESITVIEKQMPSTELPKYILAVVLMQKLSIAAIVTDNRERNIITRTYNYIINKLKTKGGASSKIRDKKPLQDSDSTSGDKESIVESYRIVANITTGTEVELNWYTSDMNLLIRDVKYNIDMDLLRAVHVKNQCFKSVPISREQVTLAGYLFRDILDPRSLDYIGIEGIINIISLSYVILWTTGHRELALLINARKVRISHDVIDVNITPNIRLEPSVKKKLAELYPYEKQLNQTRKESVVEEAITELTYSIFSHKWLPNAPEDCLKEYFKGGVIKILTPNFKNHLANLIIDLEENENARNTTE